ncbi:MAG: TonB-dependent receptor [Pseudomonadota bacterium]
MRRSAAFGALWTLTACLQSASAQTAVVRALEPQQLDQAIEAIAAEWSVSVDFGEVDLQGHESEWVLRPKDAAGALEQAVGHAPITVLEVTPRVFRLVEREPTPPPAETPLEPADTIIVTATKREADPRDLPIGISLLGQADLRQRGITSATELSGPIASFSTTNLGPGRNKYFIRGLADGSFADRSQSTVGVYFGDTPLAFNDTAPAVRVFDFERVEVLKGPQSSLFGASNIGGAIRFIPSAPDLSSIEQEYRIEGRTTKGGAPGYSADAVINLPIVEDQLAVRVTAYRNEAGGYIDNAIQGEDNINLTLEEGIRAVLRYQPTPKTTIDATYSRTDVDSSDTQYANDDLTRSIEFSEPYKDLFDLWSVKLAQELSGVTLTSVTSYTDRSTDSLSDASVLVTFETEFGDLTELIRQNLSQQRDITALVHETRAQGSFGPMTWLSGVHVLAREEVSNSQLFDFEFGSDVFTSGYKQDTTELAVFGETVWSARQDLDFTLGLRAQHTDLEALATAGGIFNDGVDRLESSRSENSLSPRVAIVWKVDPTLNVYAQSTRGQRIGGLNFNTPAAIFVPGNMEVLSDQAVSFSLINPEIFGEGALEVDEGLDIDPTQFESDTVWNTEFGLKYRNHDDRIRINAAVFHIDWSDIQSDQILPSGQMFVVNAGDAKLTGIDLENSFALPRGARLETSFVYNHSELVDPESFLDGSEGASLPSVPEVIAGANLSFALPRLGQNNPKMNISYRHISGSDILFADETPTTDGFTEVNARLSYSVDPWRFDLFVNNLLDAQGDRFAFGNNISFSSVDQTTPLRPLTVGIAVSGSF